MHLIINILYRLQALVEKRLLIVTNYLVNIKEAILPVKLQICQNILFIIWHRYTIKKPTDNEVGFLLLFADDLFF